MTPGISWYPSSSRIDAFAEALRRHGAITSGSAKQGRPPMRAQSSPRSYQPLQALRIFIQMYSDVFEQCVRVCCQHPAADFTPWLVASFLAVFRVDR